MVGLQGVCKDCGNGTLNNDIVTAFDVHAHWSPATGSFLSVTCRRCGSDHVDVV